MRRKGRGKKFVLPCYCVRIVTLLGSDWKRLKRGDNDVLLCAYLFILRFCCLPTRGGGGMEGEGVCIAFLLYIDIIFRLSSDLKEKDNRNAI